MLEDKVLRAISQNCSKTVKFSEIVQVSEINGLPGLIGECAKSLGLSIQEFKYLVKQGSINLSDLMHQLQFGTERLDIKPRLDRQKPSDEPPSMIMFPFN